MSRARRTGDTKWLSTGLFSALGFLAGGGLVFLSGLRQAFPIPGPPGTVGCGNAVIGGWLAMVIVAPVAAIVSGLVTAGIGFVVDCIRNGYWPSAFDWQDDEP